MSGNTKRPKGFGRFALDLLFPARCPWCGRAVGSTQGCGCTPDLEKLQLPAGGIGPVAGGRVGEHLEEIWVCFSYDAPVSLAIHRMKFEQDVSPAGPLGQMMAAKAKAAGLPGRFDCVVPVPVSPKTGRKRGYNQSALLAQGLCEKTDMRLLEDVLLKTAETQKQMDLTRAARLKNVKGAYKVAQPQAVDGKRVLLVDDVVTTGATLEACARALLMAGATACGALCAAGVVVERAEPG